jgi:hypothetical protein
MRHSSYFPVLYKLVFLAGSPFILFAHSAISATTPKYVQGNYAVPQTSQTTVSVSYTGQQTAGNLNVVIVGWSDSVAHVNSVKDSKGNVYQLALGPMVTGALSQSIYYAKNIPAVATNTVKVTFNTAATYADIRILEYSGIDTVNPVDVAVGAIGNSATSSSGSAKTTNATDLLVGANTVQTTTTGAGSGFTKRLLTTPDGDIAEDQNVTKTGTYSASAPVASGGWVMQMLAFRAATSAPPPGDSVNLAWNASPASSNPAIKTTGYRLHIGLASKKYTQTSNLGNTTSVKLSNLTKGSTYYYVVTALNSAGLESLPSNEVSYKAP